MATTTKSEAGFLIRPFSLIPGTHVLQVAVAGLVGLLLLRTLWVAFYNLFLHPLRRFPGPKAAAMTHLPKNIRMFMGCDIYWIRDLHEQYGPIVRVTPDLLSFTDAQAWKDIYGHRVGGKKSNPKDNTSGVLTQRHPDHPSIIRAVDDGVHGRQRRIFSNAFSDQSLKKQEPMFQHYVDMLVSRLAEKVQEAPAAKFDMVRYLNFTTFDVMGHLTFNEPLGMLDNSDYVPWVRNIFGSIKIGTKLAVVNQYEPLSTLLRALIPAASKKMIEDHFRYSDERVDRRLAKETDEPDIWSLVLKQEDGRGLDKYEMYENASLFMIAGTETTATLLSGLLYYLLKTPSAMAELRQELDEAFPPNTDVSGEKLQSLSYLAACIEEGLRIYPPAPLGLVRVTPPEGAAICGEWLPGNTKITIVHYAAYHNTRNFSKPDEFHPERFLQSRTADGESKANEFASDSIAALQPFSYGPRNCLGKNMAYFEMRLIIARLLLNFDISLCEESESWAEKQDIFALWQKTDLLCTLKPRVRV